MRKILFFLFIVFTNGLFAQNPKPPKLVVGIVVDQMRFDYLYKYWNKFGDGGFKRLINGGYQCKNLQYNYVPTYTGPGHSSIYTGTTPDRHGIISNDWFNRETNSGIYCTDDKTVKTVGSSTEKVGQMSPRNLLSTTVGDELRVASMLKSRVYGIALKDRAAILPAGHIANAAYWFDGESGNWVSSSFYGNKLPDWITRFNKQQKAITYLNQNWKPLLPIEQYTESLADQTPYETPFKGTTSVTFPYDLKKLMDKNGGQNLIRSTPFGNSFTNDFALELIKNEKLGQGTNTDMLCVSFSSTDYVGHQFGTDAVETEDVYLRLDTDLKILLDSLEAFIGKENLLVFLSADHGGATVPSYLMDLRTPGGYMNYAPVESELKTWLKTQTGIDSNIIGIFNDQVYLNETALKANGTNISETELLIADWLLSVKGIHSSITASDLRRNEFTRGTNHFIQKGFHPKRSGNVIITLEPNWMEYHQTGTTHGSPYNYDTRVPMLWYGWKIEHGESALPYYIEDIAPTISWMLNIPFPNATSGNPIPIPLKK
jgi:predicted AlkP superfamily pyrophosphatase or phosphodiesterase